MIRRKIRQLAVRWPYLVAFLLAVDDFRWGVRLRLKRFQSRSGSAHSEFGLDESVRYIETVFDDYLQFAGGASQSGRVAEVGPGDSAGVALLFRRAGYDAVDLIDRYESERDIRQQSRIYEALDARHSLSAFRIGTEWDARSLRGITYFAGEPAETYFARIATEGPRYDLIVSRSVMEHLYDPLAAIECMVDALNPGGRMIHKIDLRDHGMFTPEHPELTFLSISDFLYKLMTRNSGRPNRVLLPAYREVLDRLRDKIDYQIFVTQLVGVGELDQPVPEDGIESELIARAESNVRRSAPHLSRRFRRMSIRDLAVSGFFLTAIRKDTASGFPR